MKKEDKKMQEILEKFENLIQTISPKQLEYLFTRMDEIIELSQVMYPRTWEIIFKLNELEERD